MHKMGCYRGLIHSCHCTSRPMTSMCINKEKLCHGILSHVEKHNKLHDLSDSNGHLRKIMSICFNSHLKRVKRQQIRSIYHSSSSSVGIFPPFTGSSHLRRFEDWHSLCMQRKQELSRNGFKHWYKGVVNSTWEVSGVQETGHQFKMMTLAQSAEGHPPNRPFLVWGFHRLSMVQPLSKSFGWP